MSIFKQLEELKCSILADKKGADENSPQYAHACDKLAVINKILLYVRDGDWAADKARKRLMYAIQHGYQKAANHYETTYASIKVTVSYASKTISEKLGAPTYDILSLVSEGKTEEASYLFNLLTNGKDSALQRLFAAEVIAGFPKDTAIKRVDHASLLGGIETLRAISTGVLLNRLSAIQAEVLEVICAILYSKDPKHLKHQLALYQFIDLEIDTKELCQKLELKEDTDYGTTA